MVYMSARPQKVEVLLTDDHGAAGFLGFSGAS